MSHSHHGKQRFLILSQKLLTASVPITAPSFLAPASSAFVTAGAGAATAAPVIDGKALLAAAIKLPPIGPPPGIGEGVGVGVGVGVGNGPGVGVGASFWINPNFISKDIF